MHPHEAMAACNRDKLDDERHRIRQQRSGDDASHARSTTGLGTSRSHVGANVATENAAKQLCAPRDALVSRQVREIKEILTVLVLQPDQKPSIDDAKQQVGLVVVEHNRLDLFFHLQ